MRREDAAALKAQRTRMVSPDGELYKCAYCPRDIRLSLEPNRRLFVADKGPVCVYCRIMGRSLYARKIQEDRWRVAQDVIIKNHLAQQKADEQARKVAEKSQAATKTAIKG